MCNVCLAVVAAAGGERERKPIRQWSGRKAAANPRAGCRHPDTKSTGGAPCSPLCRYRPVSTPREMHPKTRIARAFHCSPHHNGKYASVGKRLELYIYLYKIKCTLIKNGISESSWFYYNYLIYPSEFNRIIVTFVSLKIKPLCVIR